MPPPPSPEFFFQEYLRIFLTNPYPPTKWRHSYILFYKNALITDLRYPHLFYKEKHTFWKGLRKQNLLNDFKKAFFFFLNRVFQLPLPLDLDILREPKWKGFFKKQNASQREKSIFSFLFSFLTKIKRLCFLKCAGSYKKDGCS